MHVITIHRQPPIWQSEYDCILDNERCPYCKRLRETPGETLVPQGYHGRHGGTLVLGLYAEMADGRRVGISLEVHGIRYHHSVRDRVPDLVRRPRGALLALHHEADVITPDTSNDCAAIGAGHPCNQEAWGFMIADETYQRLGVVTTDPDVDLTVQPETLWLELERLLALHINGSAQECA